jgi:hypothetical protein
MMFCSAIQAPAQSSPTSVLEQTVQGSVFSSDDHPIAGAMVSVTMAPTRETKKDSTDEVGRWHVVFSNPTGDYLIHVSSAGFEPYRRRVSLPLSLGGAQADTASASHFKIVLRRTQMATLPRVTVHAQRVKPLPRSEDPFGEPGVGAIENLAGGVAGLLPPDQAGDLLSTSLMTPGIVSTSAGLSVLGQGETQLTATLGGLSFGGTALPRAATSRIRVRTSTFDPAIGWFGAAQVAAELVPGSMYSAQRAFLTYAPSSFHDWSAVRSRLGAQASSAILGIGGDGPWLRDRVVYNYGVQLSRRSEQLPLLLELDSSTLASMGLEPDSVRRLSAIMGQLGVPRLPLSNRLTDRVDVSLRLDRPLVDFASYKPASRLYGISLVGSVSTTSAIGGTPLGSQPSPRGRMLNVTVAGNYSDYLREDNGLFDIRSGVSIASNQLLPTATGPVARVRLLSASGDSLNQPGDGIQWITVGGNDRLRVDKWTAVWETLAELRVNPPQHPAHHLTLTSNSRIDVLKSDDAPDRFGTYAFASLADLERRKALSFSRAFGSTAVSAQVWNGFVSVGDLWRPQERVQMLLGLRLEGDRFGAAPILDSAVLGRFGVRTDHVPNTLALIPRLGFTWRLREGQRTAQVTTLGVAQSSRAITLRGGIGRFRSMVGPELQGLAANGSGPGAIRQQLNCFGADIPVVAWNTDADQGPTACLDGQQSLRNLSLYPTARVLDHAYGPPESWRGNLAWTSTFWRLMYSVSGLVSLNLRQPSAQELNFSGVVRFRVPGEERPVFVRPEDIVQETGTAAVLGSRTYGDFGSAVLTNADLRSIAKQLTLTLSPLSPRANRWIASGSYTIGAVSQQHRGFDGTTAGDPRLVYWSRGDFDSRHQFLLQTGYQSSSLAFTVVGRIQSGLPFTAMVGSDINGDGYANDRAFLYSNNLSGSRLDADIVNQTQRFAASAPSRLKGCLQRSKNGFSVPNACEGPWSASLNGRIESHSRLFHRANLALAFENVLAGVDRLVHGDNTKGWGANSIADPILYNVIGFDTLTHRYRYRFNPSFGRVDAQRGLLPPSFRITLDARLDLGHPLPEQQLARSLQPGRAGRPGPRPTADQLKIRYVRSVPDPFEAILQLSDSLLLTRSQFEALIAKRRIYQQRMDSIWTALAVHFAGLGDEYDPALELVRQEEATAAAWECARDDVRATLPAILTDVQLQLLPWPAGYLLRAQGPLRARVYM